MLQILNDYLEDFSRIRFIHSLAFDLNLYALRNFGQNNLILAVVWKHGTSVLSAGSYAQPTRAKLTQILR